MRCSRWRPRCTLTCQPGLTACGGRCVDLANDRFHCGGCGQVCPEGEVCGGEGVCEITCQAGYTACGSWCINLESNPFHCGACGNACAAGERCQGRQCQLVCAEGLRACSGACVDVTSNRQHCGACGSACTGEQECVGGACVLECLEPLVACGDVCADIEQDPRHCGACGASCGAGLGCFDGRCCATRESCGSVLEVSIGGGDGDMGACAITSDRQVYCWGRPSQPAMTRVLTATGDPFLADSLSVNGYHACALSNNTAYCWGNNEYGGLGTGDLANSSTPRPVSLPAGRVVKISAGEEHSCALLDDGSAWCWGFTDTWLGNASGQSSLVPVQVELNGPAVDIEASTDHSCAVVVIRETPTRTGVFCWGQLPVEIQTPSGAPLTGIEELALANDHATCALSSSGSVACWGAPDATNTACSGSSSTDCPDAEPALLSLASGEILTRISMFDRRGCAVTSAGRVICWDGTEQEVIMTGEGQPLADAINVEVGLTFSCAQLSDGKLMCWGSNVNGELKLPLARDVELDLSPADANRVESTASRTCIRRASGVACWRDNTDPLDEPNTGNIIDFAVGFSHQCVVQDTGAVQCWGGNSWGQIGDGTTATRFSPTTVPMIDGTTASATAVAAGNTQTCALLDTGAVQCWGNNGSGQLGDGTFTNSATPVTVSGIDGVAARAVAITAGRGSHCCAVLDTGAVQCWGNNSNGKLGNSSTTNSNVPVDVVSIDGTTSAATSVSAGSQMTCATLTTGTAFCWGDNNFGQLGYGESGVDRTAPWQPLATSPGNTLIEIVDVEAGLSHACALIDDGSVYCWGNNTEGQLGVTGVNTSASPVQVDGLDGTRKVVGVAAGGTHSCAVFEDGAVRCWGSPTALGNTDATGITSSVAVPVFVP